MCVCVCVYVCVGACMYVCMYVRTYVCIEYVCASINVCVYEFMRIKTLSTFYYLHKRITVYTIQHYNESVVLKKDKKSLPNMLSVPR